jgi:hypothetical protein
MWYDRMTAQKGLSSIPQSQTYRLQGRLETRGRPSSPIIWRPVNVVLKLRFLNVLGLEQGSRIILRAHTQIVDNLLAPYLRLFQWRRSASHRLGPLAGARLVRPLVRLWSPQMNNLCHSRRKYRSADKSLVRPGRKQATATEDTEFHISYL